MIQTITQAYHQHAKGIRWVGTYTGAALMIAGLALIGYDATLSYALSAVGGMLGGAVLFPEATKWLRGWLTGGGLLAITAGITLLANCEGAAAAALAYCPPATWTPTMLHLLTSLTLFAKSGAWLPAPSVARATSVPPPPAGGSTP